MENNTPKNIAETIIDSLKTFYMSFLMLGIVIAVITCFILINPFDFFFLTENYKLYVTLLFMFGSIIFLYELVLMLVERQNIKKCEELATKLLKDKELEVKKELDKFETLYNSLPKDQIECLNNFLNSPDYSLNLNCNSRIVSDLSRFGIIKMSNFISFNGDSDYYLKDEWLNYLKNKQN